MFLARLSTQSQIHLADKAAFLALIVILLSALVPISHASTPVSGSLTTSSTVTSVTSDNGDTIIQFAGSVVFTGGISGTTVLSLTLISHPDGTGEFQASGIFTGTVLGSTLGTLLYSSEGTTVGSGVGTTISTVTQLEQGTGGLAGAQVREASTSVVTGPGTSAGTYSGVAQFGQ